MLLFPVVAPSSIASARLVALVGVLLCAAPSLAAAQASAATAVRQILLLQSFHRGSLPVDHFTVDFRVELDERLGRPVNIVQVAVGPAGLVAATEQATVDYIRALFAQSSPPDLIVTVAGPAAVFARKYRPQLFPDTPVLFASVDHRFLDDAPLGDNESAVPVTNDYPQLIDEILQLRPQTRQVFMIMGSGTLGRFWRRQLEEEFRRFRDRLTFVWSNDLSLAETLARCGSLPDDAAIVYLHFGSDAQGGAYADERVLKALQGKATAPLFAAHTALLGHGVVGGTLLNIDDLARSTADVASRLLNGAPPVTVPPLLASQPIFDWRELDNWDISESRLPPNSEVRYRDPSLWRAYRRTVLSATGVLAIQSLLIVGLLYQRRARQRAEVESRRNLALAADASRRETMSALTGSIAHELGQPLRSMIYNAQALQMMLTRNRATSDTTEEILSDIRAQGLRATQIIERHRTMLRSRQLEKKPLDLHLVIHESLALVAHDMEAREIETTVQLSSTPSIISGDPVLLQQVLVNLMMNALDAMADTPPHRRHLTIRSDVRATEVEVSVHDNGTGVPPDVLGTLFTPFTTTKSHGLGIGLTIVRTILDAHGGTIAAHNNSEGGASFVITLPRSDTPTTQRESSGQHDIVANTATTGMSA